MAEDSDEDSQGTFDGVLFEGDSDDDDLVDMDGDDFVHIEGLDADFSDIGNDTEEPRTHEHHAAPPVQPRGFALPGAQPPAVYWPFVVPTVATSGAAESRLRNRKGAKQNEEEDLSEVY